MRILALADEEADKYFEYYQNGVFDDIDIILAAGDLHREYLEFVVTMSNKPLYYVRGNHDDSFEVAPPEGCVCIEDDVVTVNGIKIAGLGGAMKYKPGKNMYTQRQMYFRAFKMLFKIIRRGGIDILLTHAPANELGDLPDLPHQGFKAHRWLLDMFSPQYMVHGHVHKSYGANIKTRLTYESTEIVNCCQYQIIEI